MTRVCTGTPSHYEQVVPILPQYSCQLLHRQLQYRVLHVNRWFSYHWNERYTGKL
jgi:hypothetical protein